MIINLQAWSTCTPDESSACYYTMLAPVYLFETKYVIFYCYALLLIADSWLAYKTTLVTCIGLYFSTFLELCFRDSRPFWDQLEISSNDFCSFDFGGPCQLAFTMTFFWPYVVIMFGFKYYENPRVIILFILIALILICWVDVYLYVLINGLNYTYQVVIG